MRMWECLSGCVNGLSGFVIVFLSDVLPIQDMEVTSECVSALSGYGGDLSGYGSDL